MNKEKIFTDVRKVLDSHNFLARYGYTDEAAKKIALRAIEAKTELMTILRRNKNWQEDNMAIVFSVNCLRPISAEKFYRVMNQLASKIYSFETDNHNVYRSVVSLRDSTEIEQYIGVTSIRCETITTAKVGMKLSRFLGAEFKALKVPDIIGQANYEKLYVELCESINPISIKRHTILSVHPADFLHMSYGGNLKGTDTWTSCHNIDDGCYRSGTLSYALDSTSMVIYTVEEEYNGQDFYAQRRVDRQIFAYGNGILLQSRLYPSNSKEISDMFRAVVQKIIADSVGYVNLWTKTNCPDDDDCEERGFSNGDLIFTEEDSTHYPDYIHGYGSISKLANYDHHYITVGHSPLCLKCGKSHWEQEEMICDTCLEGVTCAHCGSVYDDDEMYEYNGRRYCEECYHTCDCCNSAIIGDTYYSTDEYSTLCLECYSKDFGICDNCGNDFRNEGLIQIGGETYVCEGCLSETDYWKCEHCGAFNYDDDDACYNCGVLHDKGA